MKWKLGLYGGLLGFGFPKIRGPILGVPIIRIIVYWGLYWGPLIEGNYQMFLDHVPRGFERVLLGL